jgi:hypothetical protein
MSTLSTEQQLTIMRKQLANFDTLMEKMQYMSFAFDNDPDYEKFNRDLIRSDLLIVEKQKCPNK